MKRVVIFAHFDKQNIIDPYVIDYLKELRKYSEIIFVSDGDLEQREISKISDLCFDNICQKHGEYDFGSYKRGFKLLKTKYLEKFNKLDEVLFVNDSCYLVGTFERIFSEMDQKPEIDFWGLTDNYIDSENIEYHIQSYFLSFRRNVFLDRKFQKFIYNITKLKDKSSIVDLYEVGLSQFLIQKNKKMLCYFSSREVDKYIIDNKFKLFSDVKEIYDKHSIFYLYVYNYVYSDKFYVLLLQGMPLLKVSLLHINVSVGDKLTFFWHDIIIKLNLNGKDKIIKHNTRLGHEIKNKHFKKLEYIPTKCIKLFIRIKLSNYFRLSLFGIRILKIKL